MDIVFSETNQTGIIKLNRPKALNALNLEMAKKFHDKLLEWEEKDNILRVLLVGEGKHFCAGGDVKSLVLAGKENSLKHDFFKIEYKLNYLISQFSKEFLSVWNGVVMGAGLVYQSMVITDWQQTIQNLQCQNLQLAFFQMLAEVIFYQIFQVTLVSILV